MKFPAAAPYLLAIAAATGATEAFAPPPPSSSSFSATTPSAAFIPASSSSSSRGSRGVGIHTALHGVKRGRLASNVSPEGLTTTTTTTLKKKKKKKKQSKVVKKLQKKGAAASSSSAASSVDPASAKPTPRGISSSLADWAASGGSSETSAAVAPEDTTSASSSASSFERFDDDDDDEEEEEQRPSEKGGKGAKKKKKKKKGGGGGGNGNGNGNNKDRRSRQSDRLASERSRLLRIEPALSDLRALFDPPEDDDGNKPRPRTNFDVRSDVLDNLAALRDDPSECGFRPYVRGNDAVEYRMAWAGSDDAVCALCSGLHNVPLARLDEVFLSAGRGGRVEVLEVIRLLGPFPNVRNTLVGTAEIEIDNGGGRGKKGLKGGGGGGIKADRLRIAYDSMIDGTGKEIPAPQGSRDGVRRVEMDVLYADEDWVVCAVPSDDEEEDDPLTGVGSRVLLFVRERDLDTQLKRLRVA